MNNINMIYRGNMKSRGFNYEIMEDTTNNLINIFFKNTKEQDVECYSIKKEYIEKSMGRDIIDKTKKSWIKILSHDEKTLKLLDIEPFLQTFPISFWNEFVMSMKNGKETNFTIERFEK